MADIDPNQISDDAGIVIEDPEKGFRFAQVRDWASMMPELDHTSFRVYTELYSLATGLSRIPRDRRPTLTRDKLVWAMTGVNQKPMKRRTLNDTLATLQQLSLLEVREHGGAPSRNSRNEFSDEQFSFKINVWPLDPDGYAGYRSVLEAVEDYPGKGWTTEQWQQRRVGLNKPAESREQNSANGDDQGNVDNSAREQNSANGTSGQNGQEGHAEGGREQNSARGVQNSACPEPPTSGFDPLPLQGSTPPSPSNQVSPDRARDTAKGEGEEPSTGKTTNDLERQRAARFLGELVGQVPADLAATLTVDEKHQLVDQVVTARELRIGHSEIRSELTNVAGTKYLGKAWTAKLERLIEAAIETVNTTVSAVHDRPACVRCGTASGMSALHRKILSDPADGQSALIPCPECHPDARETAPEAAQTA